MVQERNFKGLKQYETLLQAVCRTSDYDILEEKGWAKLFEVEYVPSVCKKNSYDELSESEWEGCLGVACVMSVVDGVTPNMFSISKHLDIPHYDPHLQSAFEKLRINGILSNRFGVRNDPALTDRAKDTEWQTGAEIERSAWCMVAGVAGAYMGMMEVEKKKETKESEESVEK